MYLLVDKDEPVEEVEIKAVLDLNVDKSIVEVKGLVVVTVEVILCITTFLTSLCICLTLLLFPVVVVLETGSLVV